ncbi:MAG: NERD domain-containing protein, partial [Acidimicrobiia bacterium]
MTGDETGLREITARYPGRCVVCGVDVAAGQRVLHDRSSQSVRCLEHGDAATVDVDEGATTDLAACTVLTKRTCCVRCGIPLARGASAVRSARGDVLCLTCGGVTELVDAGVPGGSARKMHLDHRDRREQTVRAKHKVLGGLILRIAPNDVDGAKWAKGATGEELLGPKLEKIAAAVDGRVLHDRSIPGSSANLDHLVVVPSGVYVVDAKRWSGEVELRDVGGWFRSDLRVYVGGRDRSKVVESGARQAGRVNDALRAAKVDPSIECRAAMCFIDAEWPLLKSRDHLVQGVRVCPPRKLY